MSMSRRHFIALAEIVADVQQHGGTIKAEDLAEELADFCAGESGRFDRERFMVACLGTDGRGHYGRS